MKAAVAALAMMASVAQADATFGYVDGNELYRRITGDATDLLYAYGYVAGVADTGQGATHCTPHNATLGQITDMVKQYLASYPGNRHVQADHIIIHVLSASWPCAKKQRL